MKNYIKLLLVYSMIMLVLSGCGTEERKVYFENGQIKQVANYDNDNKLQGEFQRYDESGTLIKDVEYKDNNIQSGTIKEKYTSKLILAANMLTLNLPFTPRNRYIRLDKNIFPYKKEVTYKNGKIYNGYELIIEQYFNVLNGNFNYIDKIKKYTNGDITYISILDTDKREILINNFIEIEPKIIKIIKNPSKEQWKKVITKDKTLLSEYISNNSLSELEKINIIKQDAKNIKYFQKPTENMIKEVLKKDYRFIQKYQEVKYQKYVIKSSKGKAYRYIKNPSQEITKLAITMEPDLIGRIQKPSDELIKIAALTKPSSTKYISLPKEIQKEIYKKDNKNIQYIKEPISELQLDILKKDINNYKYLRQKKELPIVYKYIFNNPQGYNLVKNKHSQSFKSQEVAKMYQMEKIKHGDSTFRYFRNPTKTMIIETLKNKKNWSLLRNIPNPSDEMIETAIKTNGLAIKYIPAKKQKEEWQLKAIQAGNPEVMKYIKHPTAKVQKIFIKKYGEEQAYKIHDKTKESERAYYVAKTKKNGRYLNKVSNPSFELQKIAIKNYGRGIKYIKNPKEELQLIAVNNKAWNIQYIKHPTIKVIKIAFEKDYETFKYSMKTIPSTDLKKLIIYALDKNGEAIKYIKRKNQTEKLRMRAIKTSPQAIKYMSKTSKKLQMLAVKKDGMTIGNINTSDKQVMLAAIKQNGKAIKFINKPTEEMQMEAIKQNKDFIDYIKHPTSKVLKLSGK